MLSLLLVYVREALVCHFYVSVWPGEANGNHRVETVHVSS